MSYTQHGQIQLPATINAVPNAANHRQLKAERGTSGAFSCPSAFALLCDLVWVAFISLIILFCQFYINIIFIEKTPIVSAFFTTSKYFSTI